jgi:hypothetical protein
MTNEEIVTFAASLRAVGVTRFSSGDLHLEIAPLPVDYSEESLETRPTDAPPADLDAVTAAANRLLRRVAR